MINPLTLIIKTIFADKITNKKKNIPSFLILYNVSSPNLRPYNVNFNLIKHGKNLLHLPLVPTVGQEMLNQDEDMAYKWLDEREANTFIYYFVMDKIVKGFMCAEIYLCI